MYVKIWSLPSLLLTGSPMRSLMWRGCAKCTTANCCAVHTENRLLHRIEPENGKSGRAMFRVLVWGFQKAIILDDSCKIVGGDVSGRFWILFYSIRDIQTSLKQGRLVSFTLPWKRVCAYISAKACKEHTEKRFCVISAKPDQLIRIFCARNNLWIYTVYLSQKPTL